MSKLSRKEIIIFTKEELEKKSTQRLLAIKKKVLKARSFEIYDDWRDDNHDGSCICQSCMNQAILVSEYDRQIDLIKKICATRENVA